MKKIEVWETSNGEIYKDEETALVKENEFKVKKNITELCENYMFNNMRIEQVADILYENRHTFKAVFCKLK